MNFIKDRNNVCKTCTCGDRLKAESVLFWLVDNSFQIHCFVNYFFGFSIILQKNPMIQVGLCEQASIKTNRKLIQNHQSQTVLLFKTYTPEFEFDRHLEHMVSCQGMQSGLPAFLVGEFGAFERFLCKMTVLRRQIFRISPHGNVKNRSHLDRIWSYPPIH